jgi:hypothetical protein
VCGGLRVLGLRLPPFLFPKRRRTIPVAVCSAIYAHKERTPVRRFGSSPIFGALLPFSVIALVRKKFRCCVEFFFMGSIFSRTFIARRKKALLRPFLYGNYIGAGRRLQVRRPRSYKYL